MKKLLWIVLATFSLSLAVFAQTTSTTTGNGENKTRAPVFRASKDQITQVQKKLRVSESGKMDDDFRGAVKKYQAENGLKPTGSLNRATLEKMGITLTDKQKEIPVSPKSFASPGDKSSTEKKRGPVFRASKEQITQAQKMLKAKGMYAGDETGALDPATRASLKTFQEANGMKGTGTLNQATLEKMGIALTDRQKENAANASQ